MNPEIKSQWVAALRSGEYNQARDYLHIRDDQGVDSYCCLGVLSKLAVEAGAAKVTRARSDAKWEPSLGRCVESNTTLFYYGAEEDLDGVVALPPENVCEWAGLPNEDPGVYLDDNYKTLATLNDEGYTFAEIADIIEEQL